MAVFQEAMLAEGFAVIRRHDDDALGVAFGPGGEDAAEAEVGAADAGVVEPTACGRQEQPERRRGRGPRHMTGR